MTNAIIFTVGASLALAIASGLLSLRRYHTLEDRYVKVLATVNNANAGVCLLDHGPCGEGRCTVIKVFKAGLADRWDSANDIAGTPVSSYYASQLFAPPYVAAPQCQTLALTMLRRSSFPQGPRG
jgi:hypothetical protein